MKKLKILLVILLLFFPLSLSLFNSNVAVGDELNSAIEEQLGVIDLSGLKELYGEIDGVNISFEKLITNLVNGEFNLDFNSLFDYLIKMFFANVYDLLPIFLSVIAVSIFCSIFSNLRSSFLGEGTKEIVFYVSFLCVVLLLSSSLINVFSTIKITMENLTKLTEIMSPIITALMVSTGGSGVAVFKPSVVFLSTGASQVFSSVLFPLIVLITVLTVVSNLSNVIKLKKLSDSFSSLFKWIVGLFIGVFSIFITTSGLATASFDGIRLKATKYLISTGVPIIGGFLRDGFDFVVAGSILIKNAVGVAIIIMLFCTVISKVIYVATFSLLLKFTSACIDPVADPRVSELCLGFNRSLTFLNTILLAVGFMTFLTVLLTIVAVGAV